MKTRLEIMFQKNMEEVKTEATGKWRNRLYINKSMIPVKITYLIWGGINGTYSIYLNPFFISVGISETRTGFLTGIMFAVSSIASPAWGMLSDYTGRQKLILCLLCFVAAGSIGSIPLIANIFFNPTNNPLQCVTEGQVRMVIQIHLNS